jgi:hypothetical protein
VINCRCLLCLMERNFVEQFAARPGRETYEKFAIELPALSSFPAASDLIGFLHTEQSAGNGTPSKNRILAQLIVHTTGNGRASPSQELLLWTFVPMLHRVSRQVFTRFPMLAPDDIAQHTITTFLESLGSREFAGCESHLAFGLTRLLRRNAFAWAERESRIASLGSAGVDGLVHVAGGDGPAPIERAALLEHFLDRCRRVGLLTEEDLTLLAQFKLDEFPDVRYSNASRQRIKRLLAKMRRAARRPCRTKFDLRQLQLF